MTDTVKILIIVGSVLLLYLTLSYFMYRKAFVVKTFKPKQIVDPEDPFFKPSYTWYAKAPKEDVKIHAYDGTVLHATFLPSFDEKSVHTAIVLHGYQALPEDMVAIAKFYNDLGFKVLLIDERGHGQSEGDFTSFGHYEKLDLKKWIQYALRTYGATDQVLLHGVSMGAATSILASVMDLPDNVKLIVADSSFTTLTRLFFNVVKPKVLLFFLPGINLVTYYLHRFMLSQVTPLKAVKDNRIPILFWHGESDKEVPVKMGD
ncbi:MAG: alpha/beta hydrolase, partial [Bacilli bacterium]|nr:alpha/beta hydrolase [Bacilli bacterium]